jgi:putative ABC transport system ATP-binding protein
MNLPQQRTTGPAQETPSQHHAGAENGLARPTIPATVAALDMSDVTVGALRDPKVIVAEGVNWRVEQGDFWAVSGLHGAGKSDLLMLAGGVMAPVRGDYTFLGERMPIFSEDRLPHRLRLGLVFEGSHLFHHLTVAENIALPLRYHGNLSPAGAAPEVSTLLELTGLTRLADARPGALGRNWQRRAALARALALRPEVLLLDTPLTGLDSRQQHWWLSFLDELARGHPYYASRPITLVVTTANLHDWRGRARQFAMLDGKQFIPLGDWKGVEQSQHPLVRELATGGANIDRPDQI